MMTPLALARLSSAAYLIDPLAAADAVKAQGLEFLGIVGIADCQALVARSDAQTIIAIRGTQISRNLSLPELWDDINADEASPGAGQRVRSGFWHPLLDLWPQLRHYIDAAKTVTATGHSLGAVRALLLAAIVPPHTPFNACVFGPPKGANASFWSMAYRNRDEPRVYGRGCDFALNWSPLDRDARQPAPINWLDGGRSTVIPSWPIASESVADHAIDLYVSDLAALTAATDAPPDAAVAANGAVQ